MDSGHSNQGLNSLLLFRLYSLGCYDSALCPPSISLAASTVSFAGLLLDTWCCNILRLNPVLFSALSIFLPWWAHIVYGFKTTYVLMTLKYTSLAQMLCPVPDSHPAAYLTWPCVSLTPRRRCQISIGSFHRLIRWPLHSLYCSGQSPSEFILHLSISLTTWVQEICCLRLLNMHESDHSSPLLPFGSETPPSITGLRNWAMRSHCSPSADFKASVLTWHSAPLEEKSQCWKGLCIL